MSKDNFIEERIAVLSEEEIEKIQDLQYLNFAIQDLCKSLTDNDLYKKHESEIYKRLVQDNKKCLRDIRKFWDYCVEKYDIIITDNMQLYINYGNDELILRRG
ncbi:MAG: hypothetical protein FWG91_02120 [Lachnospiraceae bacterium]|nr:hypothetical protein [Lachnospiraceae bacterium]